MNQTQTVEDSPASSGQAQPQPPAPTPIQQQQSAAPAPTRPKQDTTRLIKRPDYTGEIQNNASALFNEKYIPPLNTKPVIRSVTSVQLAAPQTSVAVAATISTNKAAAAAQPTPQPQPPPQPPANNNVGTNTSQTKANTATNNSNDQPIVTALNQTTTSQNALAATAPQPASAVNQNETKTASAAPTLSAQSIKEIKGTDMQKMAPSEDVQKGQLHSDANFVKALVGTKGVVNLVNGHGDDAVDINTPITIDEAVAFALKNNYEILANDERTRSAYWDKLGAYSEYLPSAEYDYSTGMENSQPASYLDAEGNRVLNNTHHRYDRDITIRQPVIDLNVVSDILTSIDKEDISKFEKRDTADGIAYDTVNTFLKLLQASIAIRLADQYKDYLDVLAKRMKDRVDGGGAANSDLDRIKGRSELAESARIEALADYETNISDFKRLTRVNPVGLLIPDLLAPTVPEHVDDALKMAVRANPVYQSSLKKIDVAADDRNKSFSSLLPKLSVEYNDAYTYDAGGSAEGSPVDGVYPTQKTTSVMLVAQWAINGGASVAQGISGMAKTREMKFRSQDALDRINQGVKSSYTAINAARRRHSILEKAVEADERVVNGFEEQYNDGNRSLFDLLDAYEQLYTARLNLLRIIIANAQASYQVRRQLGDIIPTLIAEKKS